MSGERYNVGSLRQMAEIPDEAMPRFLAELPKIIRTVKQVEAAVDDLALEVRKASPWFLRWMPLSAFRQTVIYGIYRSEWIDDDKGEATITARYSEGDEPFYRRTEKMQ